MTRVDASFRPFGSDQRPKRDLRTRRRNEMQTSSRASLWLSLALLLAPRSSLGQNLQRFQPAPTQEGGFVLQDPSSPGHLRWQAGVVFSHARDPLVTLDANNEVVDRLVSGLTTIDALVAVGLGDAFVLGLDVPIHHVTGDAPEAADKEGFGLGDVRLVPRYRLLEAAGGVGLAVALPVTMPTGTPAASSRGPCSICNSKYASIARPPTAASPA